MTAGKRPERPNPSPLDSPSEELPPLLTAVNVLAGEPSSSGMWIRASDSGRCVRYEETAGPPNTSQRTSRDGCTVIAINRPTSAEDIAHRIQCIARGQSSPPKALAIVFDHDRGDGGLWQMSKRALSRKSTIDGLPRSLRCTSYSCTGAFFSPDRMDSATAFFATDSDLYVPSRTAHPLRRFASVVGAHRLSHACTVILAQRTGHTGFPVLAAIVERLVDRRESESGGTLKVLGFQIRGRGTLLLFIESELTSERFVAKVGLRQEADEPLYNSYELQNWLRKSLVGPCRSKIPRPLYFFDQMRPLARPVYVESLEPGVVAWKVNAGRKRSEIKRGSLRFLKQLQEATRKVRRCDEKCLSELLDPAIERAESARHSADALVTSLSRLGRCIRDFHLGKQVAFVTSHGDFGVGNILVEQHSGALTAVLDWADGRRTELPSVDPFNWFIQERRDQGGLGFVEAVEELYSTILRGSLVIDEAFLVEGRSYRESMIAALHTSVFRYVERSLRYPWAFSSDCGSLQAVTSLLTRLRDKWQSD